MNPVVEEVWHIANRHGWDPGAQLVDSRAAWDAHGYLATYSACAAAFFTVQQMVDASGEAPKQVQPPMPPDDVIGILGDRRRGLNAAHATWDVVAGLATSSFSQVNDPFLEQQLRDVSREFKGSGVYMLAWWANSALELMANQRPANFEVELAAIEIHLEEIGKSGD